MSSCRVHDIIPPAMTEDPNAKSPRRPLLPFGNLFRRAGTLERRIGPYVVSRELGRGGMGIVYAARDPRLERTVAIKTMARPDGDEEARQRFWREARAAASVNHPNIC